MLWFIKDYTDLTKSNKDFNESVFGYLVLAINSIDYRAKQKIVCKGKNIVFFRILNSMSSNVFNFIKVNLSVDSSKRDIQLLNKKCQTISSFYYDKNIIKVIIK